MKKPIKITLITILGLAILFSMGYLVFGRTLRMTIANYYFLDGDYRKAQSIYEDLAIDLPSSPYILHNLGLCYYRQGRYNTALKYFRQVIAQSTSNRSKDQLKPITAVFSYNFGNALYKAAAETGVEPGLVTKLNLEALENYKKALQANPADLDAKFNYEIAAFHLRQPPKKDMENMLQNTESNDQYKARVTYDEEPAGGKDW